MLLASLALCLATTAYSSESTIRHAKSLKPGDEVEIVNPEFDNGYFGWEYEGNLFGQGTSNLFGNNCARMWEPHILKQTVTGLPDGTYLMQVCAFDANNWDGNGQLSNFVFLNDAYMPMKHANDDAVGYRNIYLSSDGQSTNTNYRHSSDGRFVPTYQLEWNEALAMAEHLYVNSVVATVTNGEATFGLEVNRSTIVPCDHFRLVYLSNETDISAAAGVLLAREQTTKAYQKRLDALRTGLNTLLANGKPHAPQAVAEARAFLAVDTYAQDAELIDAIVHAEHLQQRLEQPFYELTLSAPGTLSSLIEAQGIQATDAIALKLNGTPNADDFAALKTLTSLNEMDLSGATVTALPANQFEGWRRLTWLTLPNGLQSIGDNAFRECFRLFDVSLPATLRSMGNYAFYYCYSLRRAVIPEGAMAGLWSFAHSGIRSLVLPASMKGVPRGMCTGCLDLTDIQFNGQALIGSNAFEECHQLKQVNLPEGLRWMDNQCFRYCTGLTRITLPSTLQYMVTPFYNCTDLREVVCLSMTPPLLPYRLHGDSPDEGTTLRVPNISLATYQESPYWKEFNIEGIDILPPTINVIASTTIDTSNGLPADYKPDVYLGVVNRLFRSSQGLEFNNGKLTVEGTTMLSTRHYTQIYDNYSSLNSNPQNTYYASLLVNGQMRADEVTIDLHLYPNSWQFLSFPFDVRLGDLDILVKDKHQHFGDVPLVIYGHDGAKRSEGKYGETWVRMTADSTLHAGQGYIWRTPLEMAPAEADTLSNRIYVNAAQNATKPLFFRNGSVEVKLQKYYSEFAHNRSWNFIGNPYPCYFDIGYMETTAPIIVWETNSYGGFYRTYSPIDDLYQLHPGQAFFIQRPLDHESVIFNCEGRRNVCDFTLTANTRAAKARAAEPSRQVFNLLLKTSPGIADEEETILDHARFVVNEAALPDYEIGRDATKFFADDAATAELYTVADGVCYSINERPSGDGIIRLGLKVAKEGTYGISLPALADDLSPLSVILVDGETGIETDLTAEGYTFHAAAGTIDDRFLIRLGGITQVGTVAASQQPQEERFYDLQGRRVSNPQPGLYIRNNKVVIIK